MTPGAMRLAPALDGELIWSDSVPDAAPLRGGRGCGARLVDYDNSALCAAVAPFGRH
jgi:hypothetical protein